MRDSHHHYISGKDDPRKPEVELEIQPVNPQKPSWLVSSLPEDCAKKVANSKSR
jgi:hypothetical protein